MNIRWIVLFATVAEEGSFTRAANRLNMAQPWISAQIRKLEEEMGVRLLDRTKTGIELTPEGRQLFPDAQLIAESSRRFRDLARDMGDVQSKTVRIGSHTAMLDIARVRKLNDAFARRYPQFSIRATATDTTDLFAALRDAKVDVALALSPLPADAPALETIPLEPVTPYILLRHASALVDATGSLKGWTIAAPGPDTYPTLADALLEPLRARAATIQAVPEVDKRAMEHFARTRETPVLMIDGQASDYADDPELRALPLPDIGIQRVLVRMAGRELGRAAARYWSMALAGTPIPAD